MSILHIAPALFGVNGGVVGGAERYALELARHMASAGEPTTLLSFGDQDEEKKIGDLSVRVIGQPYLVGGQRTNPLSARLVKEVMQADVVHCHQQHVLASSLAAATSRLTRRKVFVSDLGGGGWDISSYLSTDRWFHGHLHISEYSRRVFGHAGKKWAHVIYGGVDTARFTPGAREESDGPVVFVGRLMPHKGIDDLVRALPEDMPLEIIGQPYDKRYLADLQALAAGKQVTFRHDFSDTELVAAYQRAMCVVLPSVYKTCYGDVTNVPELLGQTLLEGMACGAPVICTKVASMPEVVENGVTGFVVPPNDSSNLREKLLWLREHRGEAAEIGAAGRRRVLTHFTWQAVVDRCFGVYFDRRGIN
jgi:glycosyltransferase involved in cell wall biosynthesis